MNQPRPSFEAPAARSPVLLIVLGVVTLIAVATAALLIFGKRDDGDNIMIEASIDNQTLQQYGDDEDDDFERNPAMSPVGGDRAATPTTTAIPPEAPSDNSSDEPSTDPADNVVDESAMAGAVDRVRQAAIDRADAGDVPEETGPRTPHPPPGDKPLHAGVKEFGNFTYVEGDLDSVPADVMAYNGKPVQIVGYMIPTKQTTEIREFLLVADVAECCFGEPPGLEHLITVRLPETRAVPFVFGEIEVTGTMQIAEEKQGGYVINLLSIGDVESVKTTGRG